MKRTDLSIIMRTAWQIEDKDARGHRAVLLPQIEYG